MNKIVAKTAIVSLALATVLAGCGKGEDKATSNTSSAPGKDQAQEFKISFRHTLIKDEHKKRLSIVEDVLKDVESKVPGAKFELEGVEEVQNRDIKMKADMASGNPPKIFESFGGADLKNYVKTNNILDITPILDELKIKDKFKDLSQFTIDGKIYGLPIAGNVEGIFYNKKIFADNQLKVPTTWEEFLQACETLKAKGITPIAMGGKDAWVLNMLVTNTLVARTAGADVVSGFVTGKNKWTEPDVVKAHQMFKELQDKGYYSKDTLALGYGQMQDSFSNSQAAMVFDGSWATSKYGDETKSKVAKDLGFFNFPDVKDGKGNKTVNASFSAGFSFSAKANDREKEVIKAFIKKMFSEETQIRGLKDDNLFPSMNVDTSTAPAIIKEISDQTKGLKTFPAFDAIVQPAVKNEVENGTQVILANKKPVDKVLEEIQKKQDEENKKAPTK